MQHISTTPFGRRPVTAGLLAAQHLAATPGGVTTIDKWDIFRDLRDARTAYNLTDRDLAVLNALMTFLPERSLTDNADLIVFPSNATLSARAHGMPESTLRRHLAALVRAGVIARHDSPNGKRYAVRSHAGGPARAFGFDLRPLLVQATQIQAQAAQIKADAALLKAMREAITLKKRDAIKLAQYGQDAGLAGDWDGLLERSLTIHRALRRKLGGAGLEVLYDQTMKLLTDTQSCLELVTSASTNEGRADAVQNSEHATEMSGNDRQNERHIQSSITYLFESKPCLEHEIATPRKVGPQSRRVTEGADQVRIPLTLVIKACPEIEPYIDSRIMRWSELTSAAAKIGPMMGITRSAWTDACDAMGRDAAATVVACILQKAATIRSPGGYLRSLTRKARAGGFSVGPMVMALLA